MSDEQLGTEPSWNERLAAKLDEWAKTTEELGKLFEERIPGAATLLTGTSSGVIQLLRAQLGGVATTHPIE